MRCDWDDTIDAFWKARNATGANGIYRYIMSGFKPTSRGVPWITLPSKERENGKMQSIRDWWGALYKPSENRPNTLSLKSADVKDMLSNLTDGMTL